MPSSVQSWEFWTESLWQSEQYTYLSVCEGLVVPKVQNILLSWWHFLIFRYLIFQIQMLWISSVSTLCSENRVTQFSIWLLLRAQCYNTDIFKSYLFHSFIFCIYLFCNDLISYHCFSYILYSMNIILLAIPHCLQACSYSKAFILTAALPGTSFP